MAYQATIINAHRNFEGTAWVLYDSCFQLRAAALKRFQWAKIDTALYNEAFTRRARSVPLCQFCLSLNHTDLECPTSPPAPWTQLPGRLMGVVSPHSSKPQHYDFSHTVFDSPPVYKECVSF